MSQNFISQGDELWMAYRKGEALPDVGDEAPTFCLHQIAVIGNGGTPSAREDGLLVQPLWSYKVLPTAFETSQGDTHSFPLHGC
ncbi:hypothetical protein [Pseudomonas putida]|uniref:hypothetical protein n=1 Tax=Pseudomonas putida TaxID=303 RepID=UPI0022DDF555|nr:hypothetical protein [Pseudomonas putida]WBM44901.1 hypothetical protein M2J85_19485 [Pseudomonas putida]